MSDSSATPAPCRLRSMTGFARTEGLAGPASWVWELRSVNGRGLELRFRLPQGFDALEPALREEAGRTLRRGNVTANLAIRREDAAGLAPDPALLDQALRLALDLAARIPGAPPPRAEALLALPGVLRQGVDTSAEGPDDAQRATVRDGFVRALQGLAAARAGEGARLHAVLAGHLDGIAALATQARAEAADQPMQQRARLLDNVAALLRDQPGLPEERIAQEVALLAARSDVTEELDRLDGHVAAARDLLAEGTGAGRRLDFLVQEFVREANTLCSKSASLALTGTGLRLKAVIEQLREQAANAE